MSALAPSRAAAPGRPARRPAGCRLARLRGRRHAAALLVRPRRPRRRLGAARIQPRAGDPAPLLLHVPARDEGGAAAARGRSPTAGRGSASSSSRSPLAALGNLVRIDHLVFYALIVWVAGLVLVCFRLPPGPRVLALGAAPRLHAAAAPVPLLEGQHDAAARLLGDRGEARGARRRAGLPRGQRHRPRRHHAAGRRGLLGAALPLPDHELHLRLRGALPRAALAEARAARSSPCRSR